MGWIEWLIKAAVIAILSIIFISGATVFVIGEIQKMLVRVIDYWYEKQHELLAVLESKGKSVN